MRRETKSNPTRGLAILTTLLFTPRRCDATWLPEPLHSGGLLPFAWGVRAQIAEWLSPEAFAAVLSNVEELILPGLWDPLRVVRAEISHGDRVTIGLYAAFGLRGASLEEIRSRVQALLQVMASGKLIRELAESFALNEKGRAMPEKSRAGRAQVPLLAAASV